MINHFALTERHIQHGLTDKDFSDYAGVPVVSFRLSEFPHWQKLECGDHLTYPEIKERADAILKRLKEANMPLEHERMVSLAAQSITVTSPTTTPIHTETNIPKIPSEYFAAILQNGIVAAMNSEATPPVCPTFIDTSTVVKKALTASTALVLRNASRAEAKKIWADNAKVSMEPVHSFPDDGTLDLFTDLHEMRHTAQTDLVLDNADENVLSYSQELDADLFAEAAMQGFEAGRQTLLLIRHARYVGALYNPPTHLTRPAIESLENGKYPPTFHAVAGSVWEIRLRLFMEMSGEDHRKIDSSRFQKTFRILYQDKRKSSDPNVIEAAAHWATAQKPEAILTTLWRLTGDQILTNPLSHKIASCIIEGAKFFDPTLINDPHPQSQPHNVQTEMRSALQKLALS
ncbi:MAG: hypothetical protein SFW62_02120 [Alphaproteobacteria bacterium]|nr:hypothetical protein [Alphaproteobacteria bacterium]